MMNKIVWINGCFDVLHYGHFQLIQYAARIGGKLVIGIDSDERVKQLKGKDRPFHTQQQREYNLNQIRGVGEVIVFHTEDELRETLKRLKPDVFVIGSDYMYKPIIGGEFAKEIRFFDRIEGFSTTKLLDDE
jgi:D-beta-D-heptose 7-phosphate kinase/D-beta-D-heptose 1-phosphate adenosyltransferase